MNTYTNIPASPAPYSTDAGVRKLQAGPPKAYGQPVVQQHFGDVYRAAGQKAAMDLSRAGTSAAGEYTNRANEVQNAAVLGGLSQLGQQQQNAYQRQQAVEDMGYGWMNQMMGMGNGLLGGLL